MKTRALNVRDVRVTSPKQLQEEILWRWSCSVTEGIVEGLIGMRRLLCLLGKSLLLEALLSDLP